MRILISHRNSCNIFKCFSDFLATIAGSSSYFVEPQDAAYVITLFASGTLPNNCEVNPHAPEFKQLKTSSLPITHTSYFEFLLLIKSSFCRNCSKTFSWSILFFFILRRFSVYLSVFFIFQSSLKFLFLYHTSAYNHPTVYSHLLFFQYL